MVSRRVYTRDDLRYLKRIYHPNGNFYDIDNYLTFDFIFDEYIKDPSLPNKLIPDLAELLRAHPELRFSYRRGRIRYGLQVFRIGKSKSHCILYQAFCTHWND